MRFLKFTEKLRDLLKNRRILDTDTDRLIAMSQLDVRAKLAPRMAAAGLLVAIALAWSFWDHADFRILRFGFAAVVACYIGLIPTARLWLLERDRIRRLTTFKVVFASLSFTLGIAWSLVLMFGLRHANLVQTSTLYALAVGLMSAPVFVGPAL